MLLYIWDGSTGEVYLRFPSMPIDVGPFLGGGVSPSVEYKGEEFRADSSLLIIEGCVEQTCNCARRFYNWDGKRFKLLMRQAVQKPLACANKKKR